MINCGCGKEIHPERYALGFKVCVVCGEKFAQAKKKFGYVSYGHKTAGAIVITSKAAFDNYKTVSSRMSKGSNMGFASKVGTLVSA
jgi:hypothetical protein